MRKILDEIAHRPWPLPKSSWVMVQTWHDLLFAHWKIPADMLRMHIPSSLQIDTFQGDTWIAIVPFRMSGIRLHRTPSVPWLSAFPELNVRTYVVADGKPGVWFFSLDAANPMAVKIARMWFHLPYFCAQMSCEIRNERIHYKSVRTHRGAISGTLETIYRPVGEAFESQRGTLEHFLTERYCLYTTDRRDRLIRGEIHHNPWRLQLAEADITSNTMTEAAGFPHPSSQPLLHFARRQDVAVWRPSVVF